VGPWSARSGPRRNRTAAPVISRTSRPCGYTLRGAAAAWRLLAALISWARANPEIENLGLYVFSTNEAAIRLYQAHGFAVEGRYPRDMKFEDGSYAGTVAMGPLLEPRSAPA